MQRYTLVNLFKAWLVVVLIVSSIVIFYRHQEVNFIALITLFAFFWLFACLVENVQRMRALMERWEPQEPGANMEPIPFPSSPDAQETPPNILLEMASFKRLGDRTFKADALKTCHNCKQMRPEDLVCLLDNQPLKTITIHAVGCQHWQPALRLAESPESSQETPPEPEN